MVWICSELISARGSLTRQRQRERESSPAVLLSRPHILVQTRLFYCDLWTRRSAASEVRWTGPRTAEHQDVHWLYEFHCGHPAGTSTELLFAVSVCEHNDGSQAAKSNSYNSSFMRLSRFKRDKREISQLDSQHSYWEWPLRSWRRNRRRVFRSRSGDPHRNAVSSPH